RSGINASGSGATIDAEQDNTTVINTIPAAGGAAINVTNTTIGSSNLTFRSLSATGGANGIVLSSTGSSGSLIVSGNAGTCTSLASTCTGGTIQNTTGHGVSLTLTKSPSFSFLKILNTSGSGIKGVNAA